MPRRATADPLALAVGRRIRELRLSSGLTMEKLAYESALGSKGHLSNIERGLVRPTVHTLQVLADHLGVLPLDLLTFPDEDLRQALIDQTRRLPLPALRLLRREAERLANVAGASAPPVARAAEPVPAYGPGAPRPTPERDGAPERESDLQQKKAVSEPPGDPEVTLRRPGRRGRAP